MRRFFSSVAVVGLILTLTLSARAEETVLTLQEGLNGYSGCVDTTLMGSAPTRNYGGATYLRTWRGSDPGAPRQNKHTIIKYDLSSVPTDKYIVSAKLEVYCYQLDWPSADPKVVAKMITRSWVEGASNGSEGVAGATWYEHDYYDHDATSQNDWAVVGGDLDPTVLDTQSLGSGQWISLDVTDAVRAHIFEVSDNNGLAVVPADEAGGANDARFYSSEYATDTALRPKLVITYTEGDPNPPEPPEPPANQLVLQQAKDGYTGCTDTSLSGTHPTMNTGRSRDLYTWRGSSNDNPRKNKSAVVKFDLSTVPADKYIVQAKLEVYCHALGYPSAEPKASIKTVTRSWVEGEGHNQAGVPGATWYEHDYFDHDATAQNDWTTRGGEFGASVLDSQPIVVDQWLSFDVTATVRAMKAETQDNHGFAIVPFDEGSGVNNASYYSSEYNFNASLRPKLVLVLAEEEELSFQEGDGGDYSNTENAYIENAFPTVSHNFSLVAGKSGTTIKCALVRFPDAIGHAMEQIPHDAIITEAKLTLTNTFARNQPISAYRVTDGWTYYSIVPTWTRRRLAFTGWTVEGCGYTDESTKSRTNTIEDTVTCTQAYSPHDWDITAAVQAWVNDANLNKGLILENRSATDLQVFYSSDEAQFESYRPILTVKFYRADIQAPKLTMTESPTSNTAQAFIEGTKDPEVDTISLTADGQPVDVVVTNATTWHAFVARDESNTAALVASSEDTDGNLTQVSETLTYVPLEAGSDDSIMMQAGDSMLVVVDSSHEDADSVEIDPGDGGISVSGALGATLEVPYDTAGEYTAACTVVDDESNVLESHEIDVTAVSMTMKPGFALGIKVSQFYDPTVYYKVEVLPASVKDQVHLLTEDEDLLTVQPRTTTDTGVESEVVLERVSTPHIQARFGGVTGRIVNRDAVSGFRLEASDFFGNGATDEGIAVINITPHVPNLRLNVELGFGATYLDGTTERDFMSNEMDENGDLLITCIVPQAAGDFETTVRAYQSQSAEQQVGTSYENSAAAYLELDPVIRLHSELKEEDPGDSLITGRKWWNPAPNTKEGTAQTWWVDAGQMKYRGGTLVAGDTPIYYGDAAAHPARTDLHSLESPAYRPPELLPPEAPTEDKRVFDVLVEGFGKLAGRKVRFPSVLTIVNSNATTLVVVDEGGGDTEYDKTKPASGDYTDETIYMTEAAGGKTRILLNVLLPGEADNSEYRWEIQEDTDADGQPDQSISGDPRAFANKAEPWEWNSSSHPRLLYVRSWKPGDNDSERWVRVIVAKIEIVATDPDDHVELGTDLVVDYEIVPDLFFFDTVELRVYKGATPIYVQTGLDGYAGDHETAWESAAWNVAPNVGAYAVPSYGWYEVELVATKGGKTYRSNRKRVRTKLHISAWVRDVAGGTASRGSGVGALWKTVLIEMTGTSGQYNLGTPIVVAEGDGVRIRPDDLVIGSINNTMRPGTWTIRLKWVRDKVGNFIDTNPATTVLDHYTWTVIMK